MYGCRIVRDRTFLPIVSSKSKVVDILKSLTTRSKKLVKEALVRLVITFNFVEIGNHVRKQPLIWSED